mgnify:CR=1 FL=1
MNYNFREYIKSVRFENWNEILDEFDYNVEGSKDKAEAIENYVTELKIIDSELKSELSSDFLSYMASLYSLFEL